MSGHSKWSSIKHRKAATDARRGQQFTKLARAITVAAREGGGDPEGNPALANAAQKARDASMPKDNIDRAIARGTGAAADASAIESVVYEAYGPGGAALMIETLTDNRNRTGSDVRHLLAKHGGTLGEPGSVAYLFEKRGVIVVDASRYSEDDLIPAIDAGAQDIGVDQDVHEVITTPSDLSEVRSALERAGVQLESAELVQRPTTRVHLDRGQAASVLALIDALEEADDVQAVHSNFDVDAEVMEAIAAG
jgi:YebC/PmpR family DNA-binding regulatory protein